jgi:septum site-determining protein MinC
MVMRDDLVAIKGFKDGLLIALNEHEEWQSVINDLAARIDRQTAFFAGAKITVDVGNRPVPKYALSSLKAALERRGLTLAAVISDSDTTLDAAQALDLRTSIEGALPGREHNETLPVNPEEEGMPGVMIRRTLRSGRVIRSEGHVVVYGDVNPGAEIIAGGDVIIWGILRGSVHAGAYGDNESVVCALEIIPTQLRIGTHYMNDLPKANKRRKTEPQVARLHNHQIVIESWSH